MNRQVAVWLLVCLGSLVLGTGAASGQSSGAIVAWGNNEYGLCDVPEPNEDFVGMATSQVHSLGVKSDGTVVAWGDNEHGQCNVPEPNEDFIAVAAGDGAWCGDVPFPWVDPYAHSLGLKSDGTIVAWGRNSDGQCSVPEPNADFVAIAAALNHSLGLKSDGTIVAWGYNGFGQCDIPEPNADFTAVAAGGVCSSSPAGCAPNGFSLGLKSDGTIAAWGCIDSVPEPNADFVAVGAAVGCCRGFGIKSDGVLVVWGDDLCEIPEPDTGFVAAAGGDQHILCLKWHGRAVAWGRGPGPWLLPEPCPRFVAVASGPYHCLGLTAIPELHRALRAESASVAGEPAFGIHHMSPNPATNRVSIGYALPAGWRSAALSVHDVAGRLVRRLDPATTHGSVTVDWDGTASSGERVASGVYFVRLEADGAVATQRIVLLR